jgi:hypothetical protein
MKLIRDMVGMLMIGDGILTALIPARRMHRWHRGPRWWRSAVRVFAERPVLTRALGVLTAVAGALLAVPRSSGTPRSLDRGA